MGRIGKEWFLSNPQFQDESKILCCTLAEGKRAEQSYVACPAGHNKSKGQYLLSFHHVEGTVLSALLKPQKEDTLHNLTKMRKLRSRKCNFITPNHTVRKWHNRHMDSSYVTPNPRLFVTIVMAFQDLRIWGIC